MSLVKATEAAVEKADHLTDQDSAAVEAMLALARKVDAWDVIVRWAIEDAAESEGRPAVPQNDNVSLSAYLKYADSLGLTPLGRSKFTEKKPGGKSDKLNGLRSVPKPA